MRNLVILLVHVMATLTRFLGPGGIRSVIAESVLAKQQLLILNRLRQRSPNLRTSDRLVAGLCALFIRPARLIRSAIVLKPSTLLNFHQVMRNRKYRLLFSSKYRGKPGPKGPNKERPCCMDHPEECLIIGFSTLGVVQMPHKFNAARRHKFDKVQYRVINWAEYNESLRQRGDLTIWVSEEAQSVWSAPRRTSRGGQRRYSDLAIETCLMLRTAYHLGLRQTQGLMGSIGTLMGLDIRVPDYSTLSRRANGVSIAQVMRQAGSVPIHLVVDSTGLKIFGEGEWRAQKHNTKGIRRRWRKLHLGLDLASGAIVCAALTHDNVGDSTALPGLLDQLDAPVTGFLADGAYDGASTRNLLRQRYGETLDVVIPPPKDAVIRLQSARDATVRDRHIAQIRSNGCMAWQTATGYNQRSRIETQMGRWKSVIGPKLKFRSFSRQITEVQLSRKVLNTMTALGRPVFERIS